MRFLDLRRGGNPSSCLVVSKKITLKCKCSQVIPRNFPEWLYQFILLLEAMQVSYGGLLIPLPCPLVPGYHLPQVSVGRKIKTFATKMVITSGNEEDREGQERESKEESVLAMLGIIGTILNLIVIIFVYIYTTL
ncbi:uncharacterized protein LOC118543568 isoform X2 [Halichoerus grypus]